MNRCLEIRLGLKGPMESFIQTEATPPEKRKNDENTPLHGVIFVVEFRQHHGRRSLVK